MDRRTFFRGGMPSLARLATRADDAIRRSSAQCRTITLDKDI